MSLERIESETVIFIYNSLNYTCLKMVSLDHKILYIQFQFSMSGLVHLCSCFEDYWFVRLYQVLLCENKQFLKIHVTWVHANTTCVAHNSLQFPPHNSAAFYPRCKAVNIQSPNFLVSLYSSSYKHCRDGPVFNDNSLSFKRLVSWWPDKGVVNSLYDYCY